MKSEVQLVQTPILQFMLANQMLALGIKRVEQQKIASLMAPLYTTHQPTYQHCIRVGLRSASIAEACLMDQKALLYAGLLHDVGKALMPVELLNKTTGWTAEDQAAMETHVMRSYELTRDVCDFSAEIILWHHRFQKAGYPVELPPPLHEYSLGTATIIPRYGRMVALADVYDALQRVNDKHGQGTARQLTRKQIKKAMLDLNPDCRQLVNQLYQLDIFSAS